MVCLMGRCVLWAGASYGPGNTVYSHFPTYDMPLTGKLFIWSGFR